jgi:hypothetical protein
MLAISVERNVPLAPLVTMNEATKFFFQSFRVQQSKINSKDGDGNTPLHLVFYLLKRKKRIITNI